MKSEERRILLQFFLIDSFLNHSLKKEDTRQEDSSLFVLHSSLNIGKLKYKIKGETIWH